MSPRLVIAFLLALVLFALLPSGGDFNPATEQEIIAKAHELRDIAKIVLSGLVLLWVFNEALERAFGPIIKKGLDNVNATLDATLKRGFEGFTDALTSEFRKSAEKLATISLQTVLQSVSDAPPQDPRREIAALLETSDESAWTKARDLLRQHDLKDPELYLPLALRYWSIGKFEDAIAVAESGLTLATENQKSSYKNSLAYYYAESDNRAYEQLARQYAAEARAERPDEPATLDTHGYVRISFANTIEEIRDGLALCVRAMQLGYSPELYFRASRKAERKIAALEPKA